MYPESVVEIIKPKSCKLYAKNIEKYERFMGLDLYVVLIVGSGDRFYSYHKT